jgi:hypothetical protein
MERGGETWRFEVVQTNGTTKVSCKIWHPLQMKRNGRASWNILQPVKNNMIPELLLIFGIPPMPPETPNVKRKYAQCKIKKLIIS